MEKTREVKGIKKVFIAKCMYHTGLDPMTMKPVTTVKKLSDPKVQRALMQFFAPENYFTVHKTLHGAGRKDLIGNGPQCLIPATPPREAIALQKQGKQPAGTRGTSGSKKVNLQEWQRLPRQEPQNPATPPSPTTAPVPDLRSESGIR
ncbi:MAG: DUF3362 domain-containing protein [Planctomycetes bacterium]|nr:DUF3362 domain-containing protein [Planctomycetota bacterium]